MTVPARSSTGLILRNAAGQWARNCQTPVTCCIPDMPYPRVPYSIDNSFLNNVDWVGLSDLTVISWDYGLPDPKHVYAGSGDLSYHAIDAVNHPERLIWSRQYVKAFNSPNFVDVDGDIFEGAGPTGAPLGPLATLVPGEVWYTWGIFVECLPTILPHSTYRVSLGVHQQKNGFPQTASFSEARPYTSFPSGNPDGVDVTFAGTTTGVFSCVDGMPSGSIAVPIAYTLANRVGMPGQPLSLGYVILTLSP